MTSPASAAEQPRAVLAGFKPKPGLNEALLAVVRDHAPALQCLGPAAQFEVL